MIFTGPIYIHWFENNGKPTTLRQRLEMRKTCGPYQFTPTYGPRKGVGFYQSSRGLSMGDATIDLRLTLANDHLSGRLSRIDGYYCDEDQDQTLIPIVARFPHKQGFLPGWTMGAGMAASLEFDIYDDIEDAARAAHDVAERAAEREREYQAKERERMDAEDAAEEEDEDEEFDELAWVG